MCDYASLKKFINTYRKRVKDMTDIDSIKIRGRICNYDPITYDETADNGLFVCYGSARIGRYCGITDSSVVPHHYGGSFGGNQYFPNCSHLDIQKLLTKDDEK